MKYLKISCACCKSQSSHCLNLGALTGCHASHADLKAFLRTQNKQKRQNDSRICAEKYYHFHWRLHRSLRSAISSVLSHRPNNDAQTDLGTTMTHDASQDVPWFLCTTWVDEAKGGSLVVNSYTAIRQLELIPSWEDSRCNHSFELKSCAFVQIYTANNEFLEFFLTQMASLGAVANTYNINYNMCK